MRSATAGRRRLPGVRAVRRRAGEVRAGQRGRDAGVELRRRQVARLELLQRQRDRPGSAAAASSAAASTPGASSRTTASSSTRRSRCSICHVVAPFSSQTQMKAYWSLPLPAAFIVSGVLQNLAGTQQLANYAGAERDDRAVARPQPGGVRRRESVCTATATVPLIAPMSAVRAAPDAARPAPDESLRAERPRPRLRANLDLYNVLNDGSVVQSEQQLRRVMAATDRRVLHRRPGRWPPAAVQRPAHVLTALDR